MGSSRNPELTRDIVNILFHFLLHSGPTSKSISYKYECEAGKESYVGPFVVCSTCGKLFATAIEILNIHGYLPSIFTLGKFSHDQDPLSYLD
jgi:hypothetical protein